MNYLAILIIGVLAGVVISGQAKSKPPIIQSRLVNIVITTSKMDRSIEFYEGTLGFKPFFHNSTSCFLKSGNVNLVLIKATDPSGETKNLCLDVNVPDLDKARKALIDSGTKVDTTDPNIVKLHDPDGNLIEVVKG